MVTKKVHVEIPTPWLQSERDGDRNREMFDLVTNAVNEQGYEVTWEEIGFRTETVRRQAPAGGFRLAYHSYGDARHVWRIKETPVPYFYSFDRLGFAAWSEIGMFPERFVAAIRASDRAKASAFTSHLRQWLVDNNLSKYRQSDEKDALPQGYVFFPLQIRNDIVARFCRVDPLKVLFKAAAEARRTGIPLVVKRHPYCESTAVSLALKVVQLGNKYVHLTNASVQQLLPGCRSVLVANSGVGFEALIHGKAVFSFASSEYDLASIRLDHLEEVAHCFSKDADVPEVTSDQFMSFYLNQLCFDIRRPDTFRRLVARADQSASEDVWCEEPLSFQESIALQDSKS